MEGGDLFGAVTSRRIDPPNYLRMVFDDLKKSEVITDVDCVGQFSNGFAIHHLSRDDIRRFGNRDPLLTASRPPRSWWRADHCECAVLSLATYRARLIRVDDERRR